MSEIDEVDQRSGLVLHFELDCKQNILQGHLREDPDVGLHLLQVGLVWIDLV